MADAARTLLDDLESDDWSTVRDAARRTSQRRTEVTRADIHSDDHGDRTLALLNGLEARYEPRARRAALRLADQMDATFVRMAYHEMIRIISPLDAELINLERELADGKPATSKSREHVERAQRRVKLLMEILDNLRASRLAPTGARAPMLHWSWPTTAAVWTPRRSRTARSSTAPAGPTAWASGCRSPRRSSNSTITARSPSRAPREREPP